MFNEFLHPTYHDNKPKFGYAVWNERSLPPTELFSPAWQNPHIESDPWSNSSSCTSTTRPPVRAEDFRNILKVVAPMISNVQSAVYSHNQQLYPFVALLCSTLEHSFNIIIEASGSSINWDFVFNVVKRLNSSLINLLFYSQVMVSTSAMHPHLKVICDQIASQTLYFVGQEASFKALSNIDQRNLAMVHLLSNVGRALGSNPPGFFDFLGPQASSAMHTIVLKLIQA